MKIILIILLNILIVFSYTSAQNAESDVYFKINDSIFAKSSDIEFYDTLNHTIQFKLEKRLTIESLKIPVNGLSFSVFVNRKKIFDGKFFSPESSYSCNCIVLLRTISDSALPPLNLDLGYPAEKFFTGTDNRNDHRIIETLVSRKVPLK
jgi:hypothetical protein